MGKLYGIAVLAGLLIGRMALAQTAPFTGTWSFEGNDNGSSSNPLVSVSSVSYAGVNKLFNSYQSGYSGQGISLQHWSATACNHNEYAQFTVQPQGTAQITLTTLSFVFSRSDEGPQQITVRSSADGFGNDIYTNSVGANYQAASISLNGGGFTSQSSGITFRIYGCNPTSSNGTLRIDEIKINGSSLPVTLLSFTAKPDGDRVQLAWITTSEYNANRFVIERSSDLGEFVQVSEVAAKGTTDERQNYSLIDSDPLPGINYYRLKQVDVDGTIHVYKPISAIIQLSEPVISVFPNPANPDRIHLRLWNAEGATMHLVTRTGQAVSGRLERQSGEADFIVEQPLTAGLYWLDIQTNNHRKVIQVMVR
ncbi:T9SS type A sorting domain-containing protein [Spirosoma aerolatum]|uniref:T9SS type A sorting domain-containing protein n=1 Tax=Spirosoma aerolatum TaxID=1211326 RepID=UPI001FE903D1|nr:T9SS type A sorting domain-containing protein [Spirosoma aerolatum]